MNYRTFGRTGEKISALGFGCMRFPETEVDGKMVIEQDKVDEMIRVAYEKGVNYFDTAPYYCNRNSETALGKAVKGFRDKVLISTKIPVDELKKTEDFRRCLDRSLTKLDMDHIDFYHFWGISRKSFDNYILKLGLLEEARKAKEEGLIRHISFSFHDEPSSIKYIIDSAEERGVPLESMLCQYNLLDRSNEEMMAYAVSKGLGTVAFKFVLGNPNMNCALSGMQTLQMVEENAALASDEEGFSEEEWKALGASMEQLKKFSELYCTGCRYCQPCPAGIEIPRIFNMFTYYNVYGLKDHAKRMFREYVEKEGKLRKDCRECGFCERKCPQHLQIRQELEKVEALFS